MPVDLILRRVFGLHPKPDRLELDPFLPADWPEASVRNVFAAGSRLDITYSRVGAGLKAEITNRGNRKVLVCHGAKAVDVPPGGHKALEV